MAGKSSKGWRLGNVLSRWLTGSQDNTGAPSAEEKPSYDKEVASAEGHIRIVPVSGGLDFYSTMAAERMLNLKASLAGPISKFVKNEGFSEVVITVPIVAENGSKHNIKSTYYGPKKTGKGHIKLIQAVKGGSAEGGCFYEFVYSQAGDDIRYVVEMDDGLEVEGFKEVIDKRPLFSSVPSIAQMSAFLRAAINRRRTVFDIIDSFKDYASPTTLVTAAVLQDAVENHGVELSYDTALRIRDLLADKVKVFSEHVILASALFLDMEVGELKPSDIEGKSTVSASVASLYTVANYYGAKINLEDWKKLFGDTRTTLAEVQEQQLTWSYSSILSDIGQLTSNRTPLSILQQIAKESSSKRTISFAKALQERLGSNDLAISDQQLALLATLSVAKCHFNPNLVSALCLFVDAEVGCIKESDLANASLEIEGLETSTYAMLAVAGAFGISLRGLNLGNLSEKELQVILPCLVRLTGVGFLGGFRKTGESKQNWHWVRTDQAAKKALQRNRGTEFTNNVLCMLPVIEQLSEIDLVHLAESGRDFIAAFQSDYDKNIVWRRLSAIPETSFRIPKRGKVRQSYSFIEGFSAYHFSRTVIGRLIKPEPSELLGSSGVIMVYHDNRDNRHYKYMETISGEEDLLPPPNTGWVWKGEIVDNTDISSLPNAIHEMSQNVLLGRDMQTSRESRLLSLIFEALRRTVLRKVEYGAVLDFPDVCELIRQRLPQLRDTVKNCIDDYTFNTILDWFEEDTRVIVQMPLRMFNYLNDEDNLDTACLVLLYSLASSSILDGFLGSYYKQVDAAAFRVLLNERAVSLLSSENAESRILGLRFLTSQELISDANARLMAEYNLTRALDDASDNVNFSACEGLVRLCMSNVVPLPTFAVLTEKEQIEEEEEEEEEEDSISLGEAVIDRHVLQDVNMELEDWVDDLRKAKSEEYRSLPFLGAGGTIDSALMQKLSRFIAVLRQTSYDESGTLPRRYYTLVSERQLKLICGVIVETWRRMVKANGMSLCDMLKDATPAELFIDQRFFVRGHEKQIYDACGAYPYLGGAGQPVTIYHLKPDEIVAPYRQVSRSISAAGKEESQFFKDLVKQFYAHGESGMVLLRLYSVEGIELSDLETFLSSFETSHSVDLRTAERFDPEHACYVPVFRSIQFTPEQIGSTYEEKADFQALMGLLGGKKISLKREAAEEALPEPSSPEAEETETAAEEQPFAAAHDESIPHEPEIDEWLSEEEGEIATEQDGLDLTPFNNMAELLRKSFNLPAEMERPLVNMLLLVERHALKPVLSDQ